MAVVLPAPKGVTPHTGNGPLPFDDWYLIQNSQWNTTITNAAGNSDTALMAFMGPNGMYQTASTNEIRFLTSITYTFGNDPANSSLNIFTIAGNWASAHGSGTFAFNNGIDQDHLDGQWDDPLGHGGTWTGRRIPYEPLRVMNP